MWVFHENASCVVSAYREGEDQPHSWTETIIPLRFVSCNKRPLHFFVLSWNSTEVVQEESDEHESRSNNEAGRQIEVENELRQSALRTMRLHSHKGYLNKKEP